MTLKKARFALGDTNSPLPSEGIYAETSIWARMYFDDNYAAEVEKFLRRASQSNVPIYTSQHAKRELRHAVLVSIFSEEAQKLNWLRRDGKPDWQKLFKQAAPAHMPKVEAEYQKLIARIDNDPGIAIPKIDDDDVFQYYVDTAATQYALDSADAQHVATMRIWGLNSLATTDGDYSRVENCNLYLPEHRIYTVSNDIVTYTKLPWEL